MAYLEDRRWEGEATGFTRRDRRPCDYAVYMPDAISGRSFAPGRKTDWDREEVFVRALNRGRAVAFVVAWAVAAAGSGSELHSALCLHGCPAGSPVTEDPADSQCVPCRFRRSARAREL